MLATVAKTAPSRLKWGRVWEFKTARFTIALEVTHDRFYRYDGDDPDGETQTKLNTGEYVAFDSDVSVYLDGQLVGCDFLGGSVYGRDDYSDFWTAHRTSAPEDRNFQPGQPYLVCHYFPGMVRQAIADARKHLRAQKQLPYIRPAKAV